MGAKYTRGNIMVKHTNVNNSIDCKETSRIVYKLHTISYLYY